MFLPTLFTKSRPFYIIWGIFVLLITNIFGKIGDGEKAAIWCFSSIIIALPFAIFEKQISQLL